MVKWIWLRRCSTLVVVVIDQKKDCSVFFDIRRTEPNCISFFLSEKIFDLSEFGNNSSSFPPRFAELTINKKLGGIENQSKIQNFIIETEDKRQN